MTFKSPTERFVAELTYVRIVMADHFTPIVRQVARRFRDFGFTLWLMEQPRWQRPLMRFAYRVERWLLR